VHQVSDPSAERPGTVRNPVMRAVSPTSAHTGCKSGSSAPYAL
jgi:hypothetical protein